MANKYMNRFQLQIVSKYKLEYHSYAYEINEDKSYMYFSGRQY